MVVALYILLTPLMAWANRYMRGEGNVARWIWFAFNAALAWLLTLDLGFAGIWLTIIAAYTMPPTQALFCVLSGRPPGREDTFPWRWIGKLASIFNTDNPSNWVNYGIYYGTVRALLTVPSIALMCWHAHSLVPAIGLLFLLHGAAYLLGAAICRKWLPGQGAEVKVTEWIIGAWLGVYLIICAGVL